MVKTCECCGKNFEATHGLMRYCSDACIKKNHDIKRHKRSLEKMQKRSVLLKKNGVEGVDYIIDLWNGLALERMSSSYVNAVHPGKTISDYKAEFPLAKTVCEKVSKACSRNAGLWMKEEKYKKMFSEKVKGEKNPNHRSRTTLEERQKRSPFSEKFYEIHSGDREKMLESICAKREYTTRIEYYLNRGYSEEDARLLLQERQSTFTLEKCIQKYGESKGVEIYNLRQKRWSEKVEKQYAEGKFSKSPKHWVSNCFSKKEKEFVSMLFENAPQIKNIAQTYLTKQLSFFDKTHKCRYFYDFCYNNKIIEFNGDFWHCNPLMYDENYYHKVLGCAAKDIWIRNSVKYDFAKMMGYEVLVVWENDFDNNKSEIVDKCLRYLLLK